MTPQRLQSLEPPEYRDHTRLMIVLDGQRQIHQVESPTDWDVRRAHILASVPLVMGRT